MATATLTARRITESNSIAKGKVEEGVIRGVKLLGPTSKNMGGKRRYAEQAITEAFKNKLYEGAIVYIDHPGKGTQPRGYRDRFGRVENVRLKGADLFGDLKFNPKHALAEQVRWDAENSTEGVGLSHNISAGVRRESNGGEVIEEITKVNSVDLVDGPATTKNLFECEMKTVAEIINEHKNAMPAKSHKLLEAIGVDPVLGPAMGDAPANPDEAIKQGMRTAVMAAFDDPSLDSAETLAKIQMLLTAQDAALGRGAVAPPTPGDKVVDQLPPPKSNPDDAEGTDPTKDKGGKPDGSDAPDDAPAEGDDEEKKKKKFEQIERRANAMEALATFRITPRPELVTELMEQTTTAAMKAKIALWPPAKRQEAKPPISTVFEQQRNVGGYPQTREAFIQQGRRTAR